MCDVFFLPISAEFLFLIHSQFFSLIFFPSFDLLNKYCSFHVQYNRQTICLIVTINHPPCKLLFWKRSRAVKCNRLVCWNWSLYRNLLACRIIDRLFLFVQKKLFHWTLSLVVAVVVRLLGFRPDLRFNIQSLCVWHFFSSRLFNQEMGWFVAFCFHWLLLFLSGFFLLFLLTLNKPFCSNSWTQWKNGKATSDFGYTACLFLFLFDLLVSFSSHLFL